MLKQFLAGLVLLARAAAADDLPLRSVADVPLGSDTGRFDYQAIDPAAGRLYISHMGAGTVIVFDLKARRVVAELKGFPGATGIATATGHIYVSITGHWWNAVAGGGHLAAIDGRTLNTLWEVSAGRFPDGIAAVGSRLFVSDERGEQEMVINAANGELVKAIPLGGEAGMTQFDRASGRVLVNVQTKDDIAVIDPAKLTIERRIALPADCDNNHGLLIDGQRAYVACDGNAKLMVLNLASGNVAQKFGVGDEPDVLALDSSRQRLYVASESGMVSVIDTLHMTKLGQGLVGDNAHSVAADGGLVYFPLHDVGGRPVLRIMEGTP